MSEPLLFSLPSELVGSIVLSKLSLRDIVQLDSAVLARKYRIGSLACWYRRTYPIHVLTQALGLDYTVLKWLLQRSLCPEILYICDANMNALSLIRENASLVKSKINIRIGCCNTDWESFIGQAQSSVVFDKITEMEIFVVHPHAELGMPPALGVPLRQLSSLLWHSDGVPNSALTAVVGNAAGLTALMVDCQLPLPADFSAALCARQDTLTELDLRVDVLTDSDLTEIASSCRQLTSFHLYIPWHSGTDGWVTDAGVHSVVTICERLESIYIYSSALTAASVTSIFAYGRSLTRVHVDFTGLSDAALQRRPPSSTSVRELFCCWAVSSADVLATHGNVLAALTHLEIAGIGELSMSALCVALRDCVPHLRILVVRPPFQCCVPAALLDAIAQGCGLLTKLHVDTQIRGDAQSGLVYIARNNPLLEDLLMSDVTTGITDAVLTALAGSCANLRSLHLFSCRALTDASVTALARGCSRLTDLHLRASTLLTDATMLALADHCRSLQTLYMEDCAQIREPAIVHLVRSCKCPSDFTLAARTISETTARQLQEEFKPRLKVSRLPRSWVQQFV
jgi:hypothetical protein